jgi:hypothetical protein
MAAVSALSPNLDLHERRRRARIQVHWLVRFQRHDPAFSLETPTRNLSSDGFHFAAKAPFVPGESWTCTLSIPAHDPKDSDRILQVQCTIRIAWVHPEGDGTNLVGCQIEHYHFPQTQIGDRIACVEPIHCESWEH